jgi:SAM-dependent methyltransferase
MSSDSLINMFLNTIGVTLTQKKQNEWYKQWSMLRDDEFFLFQDWIYPYTMDDFRGKEILECGCGSGQHTAFIAPIAKSVTAVDLNTIEIARQRNIQSNNVEFIEADIATMNLPKRYDIVFSIGVIHHTDEPEKTFENLKRHVKKDGILIVWVYSMEGNILVRKVVEPIRKVLLKNLSRKFLLFISKFLTAMMYVPIYTVYMFPLSFLPYYHYFKNFRKLSFYRNTLNVFDKLNAPQVDFISKKRIQQWFSDKTFKDIHISSYNKVSWRGSGRLRFE